MTRAKIENELNFLSLSGAVAKELGCSQTEAQAAVQAVIDVTGRALASGFKVKLANAFTLTPAQRTIPAGALGGRVTHNQTVKVVRFHLNGRLLEAVRSGNEVTTLKKSGKSA